MHSMLAPTRKIVVMYNTRSAWVDLHPYHGLTQITTKVSQDLNLPDYDDDAWGLEDCQAERITTDAQVQSLKTESVLWVKQYRSHFTSSSHSNTRGVAMTEQQRRKQESTARSYVDNTCLCLKRYNHCV